MLFIIMSVIIAVMGIFISMIKEEAVMASTTPKRWTHKRVRIARDREGVSLRNSRCLKGHLPVITGSYGPNRKARRAANPALKAKFREELNLLLAEDKKLEAYRASNSNRLRAERRWEEKGTVRSSSIRRKAVVAAIITGEANVLSINEKGLTKAQVREQNLNAWAMWSTKRKERRSSKQERKSWALLESRCFMAISRGDNSPATMAMYHAARSAA